MYFRLEKWLDAQNIEIAAMMMRIIMAIMVFLGGIFMSAGWIMLHVSLVCVLGCCLDGEIIGGFVVEEFVGLG